MRTTLKTLVASAAAATAMLGAATASATPSADGVFFVHGTGDYCPPSSSTSAFQASGKTSCGYTSAGAVDDYWTASSLQKMATSPDGSGQWSYGVAGYPGASQNAMQTWGTVADQLWDYYWNGNNGAIYDVVVVTHSNGSNPIRYLLAHPTAVTPNGHTASDVIAVIQKVIFLAGDNAGTPLADKVTSAGTIASIGNSILTFFGGSSWNNPAVNQQIQANMATYNSNGTFATGTTPGGIETVALYGSNVYASIWSSDAWCGGYGTTVGLKAAQIYGWGSWNAPTDGFIGTNSSTLVGTDPYGGDGRLNHNQSRRSCHGVGSRVASQIHGALQGTFSSPPPDYQIAPAAQACNATTQGWSGSTYFYGCTSSMQTDSNTDVDCYVAYGGDNGYVAPQDFSATGYSNAKYYGNGGVGCDDSWLGDGTCDLFLVAKYGYDAANGGTGPDDCVNSGAGTTNTCYDIAWSSTDSAVEYLGYTATH